MSALKLTLLLMILTVTVNAQSKSGVPRSSSVSFKTTSIKVEDYKIKQAKTAYDLATNQSYFHHLSQGFKGQYLILPVLSINDNWAGEESLKEIDVSEILNFQFESGINTTALYGARGAYGHLRIYIDDKKQKN